MKKNNMLRIASVLLVAVLLSTCAISGAFAKYTTSATTTPETAQVAEFGINVSLTGATNGAFMETYDFATSTVTTANGFAVDAATDLTDVVAPGTEGTLASASITGTAEVAVRVTEKVTLALSGWMIDADGNVENGAEKFYCPLTIAGVSGLNYTSANAFIEAVAGASVTNDYDANHEFENGGFTATEFDWEWAHYESVENDAYDTLLGRNAAANTVTVTVSVTVDQID